MKTVYVVTNTGCNLKCPYCYYVTNPSLHRKSALSPGVLASFLSSLREHGFGTTIFTGGEPTQNRHILEYIRGAKESGFIVGMITNGSLVTKSLSKQLREAQLDFAFVSIDDIDAGVLTDIRGTYAKIINGLDNLRREGIPTTVNVVITAMNKSHLFEIYTHFESQGIPVSFHPVYLDTSSDPHIPLRLEPIHSVEVKKQLELWGTRHNRSQYLTLMASNISSSGPIKPSKCEMGVNTIVLDADGAVFPCFYRKDLRLGSVFDNDTQGIVENGLRAQVKVGMAQCFGTHCVALFSFEDEDLVLTSSGHNLLANG